MNKTSIEELASRLTEEEKQSILQHGKLGKAASYLTIPAAFLIVACMALSLFKANGSSSSEEGGLLTVILLVAAAAVLVVSGVLYFITKKKCPKYKETLYNYLKNQQKQG